MTRGARLARALLCGCLIIGAGLAYAYFVSRTGIAIPCPFRLATGLKCPGCGITHMCVAMLHGDFGAAYRSNRLLFFLLPPIAAALAYDAAIYVRDGIARPGRLQNIFFYACIALLVAFAVLRNPLGW